jgi:FKBP-type peptidyl-prolyl cis-trans isomerase
MKWLLPNLFFLLFLPFSIFSEEKIPPAYLIANQIKKGLENQEDKYISALISGIEAREKGILLSADEMRVYSLYVEKKREFLAQKNLREAENWMKSFESKKNVHSIVPSKLAYSLVKKGNGALLTREFGKVSVNYSIKKLGDHFPETIAKGKELDLTEVIPGLAHGMLFMQEGEIRTIYIHPELAYRTHNFDPNVILEATVELLQILPCRVEIPSLREIPRFESPEITQDELDRLELTNYYVLGWKLWDHLRWGYKLFTKEDVISFLKKEPLQIARSEYDGEINKIHWKIYHQRIEDENTAADVYFKNLSSQPDIKCLAPGYLYCRTQQLRETPTSNTLLKAKMLIKDREGKILRKERVETIRVEEAIKGLRESLPHLISQEPATLFIHPKWAYQNVDGPLGDTLLIIDVAME